MHTPRLSIIVPTPDGVGLTNLFTSLGPQLAPGDEVLVVGDTYSDPLVYVEQMIAEQGNGYRYLPWNAGYHAWGHPQRNAGIQEAVGDYLVFIDDDDVFAENALADIRQAIAEQPSPRLFLFRFRLCRRNITLWQSRQLREGMIGGHEFVVPNIPWALGKWGDRYEGDFDFIRSTVALWPSESLIWREEIISIAC